MIITVTCDIFKDFEVELTSSAECEKELIFIDCQADNEVRVALSDEQLQQVCNRIADAGFEPDS
jgi:hypothetical protein